MQLTFNIDKTNVSLPDISLKYYLHLKSCICMWMYKTGSV